MPLTLNQPPLAGGAPAGHDHPIRHQTRQSAYRLGGSTTRLAGAAAARRGAEVIVRAIKKRAANEAPAPPIEVDAPAGYLTDGVNLYRFIGWVGRSMQTALVELEDCRSLEVVLVRAEELGRARLRPVFAPPSR